MRRRRFHPYTTRDRILDDLRRAVQDTLRAPAPPPLCQCDDCRIARAVDVTPHAPVLLVTPENYQRMQQLAGDLGWTYEQLAAFTQRMFQKQPVMLLEREAGAIMEHLKRKDVR